jgi:hypothetical protein
MPSLSMTVPYLRASPVHIPRRDLVLAAADSLFLRVTVVDSDNPCAQAIEISGGIGGPSAQFTVWADAPGRYWRDYGWPLPVTGQVMWNGIGATSDVLGAFDFTFPSGTMAAWPRRCGWCVQLNYDTQGAEVLATGRLHVRYGGTPFLLPATVLATDSAVPILTDTMEQVLA